MPNRAPDPGAARRILVVTKFRYLGDTIVATPFLRRLRPAAPKAAITLLSGPAIPSLLENCPYIDRFLTLVPNGPGGLRRSLAAARSLRGDRFDTAFLLNRSLHSALLARQARIPGRIGFDTEGRGPLLTTRVPYDGETREIDCYLSLLRAVGVDAPYALPELWVTPAERETARRIVEGRADGPIRRPLILLQPGTKDAFKKQWGPERFARVADGISAARPDAMLASIGSADEEPACRAVAALSAADIVPLAGATGLREVLGLLAEADLLVANDTALVHAAVALGTRTVSIHGPQTAGKWGYGPPHAVVSAPASAGNIDRAANRRALDRIPAGAVLSAALGALRE